MYWTLTQLQNITFSTRHCSGLNSSHPCPDGGKGFTQKKTVVISHYNVFINYNHFSSLSSKYKIQHSLHIIPCCIKVGPLYKMYSCHKKTYIMLLPYIFYSHIISKSKVCTKLCAFPTCLIILRRALLLQFIIFFPFMKLQPFLIFNLCSSACSFTAF
jgi:hypothetical protein